MYVDKLDGKITQDYFDRKSEKWRTEQKNILRKIEEHQNANQNYLEDGIKLLELSQKTVRIYEKQNMYEKRRIIDFVFSNSTWKEGKLIPNYRKPFDLIVLTNTSSQNKKAVLHEKDGKFENWLRW